MSIKQIAASICGFLIFAATGQQALALSYPGSAGTSGGTYAYQSDSLVNDNGTIYFISGTVKVPFASWPAFTGLGYSPANVTAGDTSNYTLSQGYSINTPNTIHPWG